MPYPLKQDLTKQVISTSYTDASAAQDVYIGMPVDGRVLSITIVPHVALTGASTIFTPSIGATQMQLNGSNITLTITTGTGTAGTANTLDLSTGTNRFNAGDVIKIASDGGATNGAAAPATVTVLYSTIN